MALQTNNMSDDARLVSACRKGSTSAFESLVHKHQRMMLNVAFRMTGSYDDACDITQEAFISAWRKISEFKGETQFYTWLISNVINQSKSRSQQLQVNRQSEAYAHDTIIPEVETDRSGHPPSSLEKQEETELRQALNSCINKLPPEFLEVLVLRDMQGLSYEDIRDVLGVQEGTIKSRLFMARDGIKECLKDSMGKTEKIMA